MDFYLPVIQRTVGAERTHNDGWNVGDCWINSHSIHNGSEFHQYFKL
jgi:hypothetical protein